MISQDVIGREYPSYKVHVEKGQILDFAAAIGDGNAAYADGNIAPPTFPTMFRHGEFGVLQDLKVDLRKLLHGEQEYEYVRPIRAGDVLTCFPKILDVRAKEGRNGVSDFLTTEVTVRDPVGALVCQCRSTVVVRR